jgi:hypothetical protein
MKTFSKTNDWYKKVKVVNKNPNQGTFNEVPWFGFFVWKNCEIFSYYLNFCKAL